MAGFPAPNSSEGTSAPGNPPVSAALLAYALFGVGAVAALISAGGIVVGAPLMGVLGIIGVIICYVKRDDAQGTWVASHFSWLIRTFWYSFLWGLVGAVVLLALGIILIGIPIALLIWAAASIWVIYRVVRGYLLFKESKPIPAL